MRAHSRGARRRRARPTHLRIVRGRRRRRRARSPRSQFRSKSARTGRTTLSTMTDPAPAEREAIVARERALRDRQAETHDAYRSEDQWLRDVEDACLLAAL